MALLGMDVPHLLTVVLFCFFSVTYLLHVSLICHCLSVCGNFSHKSYHLNKYIIQVKGFKNKRESKRDGERERDTGERKRDGERERGR